MSAAAEDVALALVEALAGASFGRELVDAYRADAALGARLAAGTAAMLAAGVVFDAAAIELLVDGEEGERETRFAAVPGYAEVDAVLERLFNGPEDGDG